MSRQLDERSRAAAAVHKVRAASLSSAMSAPNLHAVIREKQRSGQSEQKALEEERERRGTPCRYCPSLLLFCDRRIQARSIGHVWSQSKFDLGLGPGPTKVGCSSRSKYLGVQASKLECLGSALKTLCSWGPPLPSDRVFERKGRLRIIWRATLFFFSFLSGIRNATKPAKFCYSHCLPDALGKKELRASGRVCP